MAGNWPRAAKRCSKFHEILIPIFSICRSPSAVLGSSFFFTFCHTFFSYGLCNMTCKVGRQLKTWFIGRACIRTDECGMFTDAQVVFQWNAVRIADCHREAVVAASSEYDVYRINIANWVQPMWIQVLVFVALPAHFKIVEPRQSCSSAYIARAATVLFFGLY